MQSSLLSQLFLVCNVELGETSTSDWQETIRLYPAPWAELAVDNVILTVPADSVRQIQNPETLLSIWDLSMKAVAELAAIPATFPRPERIVADVQISAGKENYIHNMLPFFGLTRFHGVLIL